MYVYILRIMDFYYIIHFPINFKVCIATVLMELILNYLCIVKFNIAIGSVDRREQICRGAAFDCAGLS